jgi:hypothetical protein
MEVTGPSSGKGVPKPWSSRPTSKNSNMNTEFYREGDVAKPFGKGFDCPLAARMYARIRGRTSNRMRCPNRSENLGQYGGQRSDTGQRRRAEPPKIEGTTPKLDPFRLGGWNLSLKLHSQPVHGQPNLGGGPDLPRSASVGELWAGAIRGLLVAVFPRSAAAEKRFEAAPTGWTARNLVNGWLGSVRRV